MLLLRSISLRNEPDYGTSCCNEPGSTDKCGCGHFVTPVVLPRIFGLGLLLHDTKESSFFKCRISRVKSKERNGRPKAACRLEAVITDPPDDPSACCFWTCVVSLLPSRLEKGTTYPTLFFPQQLSPNWNSSRYLEHDYGKGETQSEDFATRWKIAVHEVDSSSEAPPSQYHDSLRYEILIFCLMCMLQLFECDISHKNTEKSLSSHFQTSEKGSRCPREISQNRGAPYIERRAAVDSFTLGEAMCFIGITCTQ